jgi:hypothetical protein
MFAGLPAAVQHTIRAETGGEQIEDIVQDTSAGGKFYRVYFEWYEVNPPLYVAADGSVLNYDLTVAIPAPVDSGGVLLSQPVSGLKISELPPEVVQTLQARADGADIQSITKEVRAGGTVYVIKFRDHRLPELYIASEGGVVKEVSR